MKHLIKFLGGLTCLLGLLAVVGVASAATVNDLQPASTVTYNEELVVNNTARFDSIYVGKQDVGGVTFFNGTIVNSTTNDGADNPVTFGDNVRIDGEIYRTEKGGDNPLKISDHVIPTMHNTNDFGSTSNAWRNGYFSGEVDGVDVSHESTIYLHPYEGGVFNPGNSYTAGTPVPGKTIIGEKYIDCSQPPADRTVNLISDFFTSVNSYVVTVSDVSDGNYSFVSTNKIDNDSFELNCDGDYRGSFNWIAIGY